jgi:hypothetical protein
MARTQSKTTRKYDVAVKVGEYEDSEGNTKGRYENVGVVLDSGDGEYMLLKKTFNPAGVNSDGDRVILSFFEPREDDEKPAAKKTSNSRGSK